MKPVEIEFLVKNNTRQGLSKVSGGIDGVEKDATETKKSIQALEAEIARLQNVISQTPQMDQTENIRQIESLKRQLQALQATAQSTDLVPASAPKAVRSYNGLNMAIQQLARELPVLSMGPQMFFMAISNNLPIFTDELARARREYEMLTASGQKATPVWKQVLSSIGSFQTLMAIGIALSVAYGREIGNFVSSLFRGEAAARTMADAQREVNETMIADAADYGKQVAAVRSLSAAWKTLGDDLETRKKFIEDNKSEFDKLGVSVGNVHDAENLLVTNTDAFVASLERRARAVAAQQLAAEQYKKSLEYEIKAQELENKAADVRKNEEIDMTAYAADTRFGARSASELAEERAKSFEDEAAQLRKLKAETDNYASSLLQIQRSEEEAGNKILENAGILSADTISGKTVGSGSVEPLLRQYAEAQRKFREEIDEQSVAQMEDGFAKERATIRLTYEKKRREYETQEHETLALIKRLRTAGANIGSDAEKSVMAETDALVAGAVELRDQELAEVDRKETESFDKLLEKYETYQQGRLRIAREYDAEIAKLAANPENQEIARRAKQKALDDFTERFAEQFPEFETWSNRIIMASVKKLDELLIEVQEKLENLQGEIPGDNNAIAVLQAAKQKIEKRRAELNAKKKEEEERAMDTTSWTELHRVLTDVVDTFNEVGEAIGGAAGEIISVAGKVSASTLQMVNAIQAYRTAKSNGNKLGMASGILGGISAGVSALTSIFSLFKGGETSLERNLRLAREFNEELRIMKERSKINSDTYDSIFGDRLYDRYRQNVEVVRTALDGLSETQEQIMTRGKEVFEPFSKGSTGLANLDKVAKTWETVADSVYNMQVQTRHSTWFRSAKYKSLGSLVPELFDDGELNMEALKEFVENGGDTFKHLSDANRELLQSLVDDWETYEEAIGAVNDYLQDIFGDLGNTLTDALVDAFENGTDAADSFVESVGQAMRKLAKDMIYSNTLGQVFEDAEKRFDEINRESYSDEERFSKWSEAMQQLMTDALGQQDEFNKLWAEFRRIAAESGISIDSMENTTQQSGKSGAMQTVSQESFSRVEGLVTSIQIHSANFDDNLEGIVPVLGQSLNALQTIAGHTGSLPQIYELLEAIRRDGLKVN
ncbi:MULTISPECIES: hypothetical protein [Alistipes]|uniref:hypothetical protein n=1 Tax=Alistipes TaxID=239759 RepID=UPI001B39FAF7|nr:MULTISPECIES: hypothetical protein [Alistipes]MBQ4904181.1 hypothetical protein [Alistipes sp. Marseille-P2263]MCI2258217.1 hypothetical protein [Alistipes dispar]